MYDGNLKTPQGVFFFLTTSPPFRQLLPPKEPAPREPFPHTAQSCHKMNDQGVLENVQSINVFSSLHFIYLLLHRVEKTFIE